MSSSAIECKMQRLAFVLAAFAIATSSLGYQSSCPEGVDLCHPANKCRVCHPSCRHCQNLSNNSCASDDCMSCHAGQSILVKYSDGTGPCVDNDEAYIATCPKGHELCKPGNRCLACPRGCRYCQGNGTLCGVNDCTRCEPHLVLATTAARPDRGSCRAPSMSWKLTCPRGVRGCSTVNQCHTCSEGCLYCTSPNTTRCPAESCLKCKPDYYIRKSHRGSTGHCVPKSQFRSESQSQQAQEHNTRPASAGARGRVVEVEAKEHQQYGQSNGQNRQQNGQNRQQQPSLDQGKKPTTKIPTESMHESSAYASQDTAGRLKGKSARITSWRKLVSDVQSGKLKLTVQTVMQACALLATSAVIRLSQALAILVMF
eukprot:TRINITY_DN4947_c0_g1_i3.p1 TRINITY_DN4947_c0_g1~~TRINITY_DN4947_c0_g1_i3.p1  ORF type:complete len:371 (+),score=41.70 TRINITY_DN4947_c0_g1_i3:57-1169(+)